MPRKSFLPDIRIDDNLKLIVGDVDGKNVTVLPTTEFIKAIWLYIKKHDLKIPKK